nr:hypothetical protein [uncultured Clostridium sp.]
MNLNKKELRKLSFEFNSMSNRLLRSSYQEFNHTLKRFLGYIDDIELIKGYIQSCTRDNFDVRKAMEEIDSNNGRGIIDLGNTDEEEVYTVYNTLLYIAEKGFNYYTIGRSYSGKKNFNEIIKDFNDKFSYILIIHISGYLTKIGIEMGIDEEVNYMITNNGGQVNISKDTSTLNAVQNIGTKSDELASLVGEINKILSSSDIPKEEKEIIGDTIETIQSELQNDTPKKGLIRSCIAGLKSAILAIPTAIELSENISKLIEYASSKIS